MNNDKNIDYRNPTIIRRMGINVLTKELGPIGMIYFMQLFERGEGDYTTERQNSLSDITMDEALHDLTLLRERQSTS